MIVLALLWLVGCREPRPVLEMVPMRDGVHLATDVYVPRGSGPFPTIVFCTPYGRGAVDARGFLDAGVAVVDQDMRGRFDSEGVDRLFTTDGDGELQDGYDTLEWVVGQPWSNQLIGTSGQSADGIVQYLQATADPPGLVVMNPEIATPNMYSDAVFQGGAYREALVDGWLESQGSEHFKEEIVAHPFEDEFWAPVEAADAYAQVHAAGFHVAGWFDCFQRGTLSGFSGLQTMGGEGAAGHQKLIVGPWTHTGLWQVSQGELTFPDQSFQPPHPDVFDVLFNHHLELDHPDITGTPDDIPNVQYYVMGDVDDAQAPGNEWRVAEAWPPSSVPLRLYLQADGGLDQDPSAESSRSYTFDPADPAPTVCGANLFLEAGPCDQRDVEARSDVLVFQTPVLDAPLEVTGRLSAHLFVDLDRPDADLVVALTDVYPDGRSMLMSQGVLRLATRGSTTTLEPLTDGEIVEAVVDMGSTSLVLDAGHRLRISVTSSSWPRYAVNQGNGLPWPDSTVGPGEPVTVTLHLGGAQASWVELPTPPE